MVNQKSQVTPSGQAIEVKSPTYRETYANFSRVGLSPWDISLVFGTLNDPVPGKQQTTTVETAIKMSPQQFKALATSLPLILLQWETSFGQINLGSQFMVTADMLKEAFAKLPAAAAPGSS